MSRAIAIIPARGGSKRIPRKNIKNFLGRPIISYPIIAAKKSNLFSTIFVSTDDIEIQKISMEFGAECPFLRTEATSDDFATTADVITEVLDKLSSRGQFFDHFCCIYPTASLITYKMLEESYHAFTSSHATSLMSVVEQKNQVLRSLIMKDGFLQYKWPEYKTTRTQDLENLYFDAGQFYWVGCDSFLSTRSLVTDKCCPFVVEDNVVQDIDNIDDWLRAEIKYQALNAKTLPIRR